MKNMIANQLARFGLTWFAVGFILGSGLTYLSITQVPWAGRPPRYECHMMSSGGSHVIYACTPRLNGNNL